MIAPAQAILIIMKKWPLFIIISVFLLYNSLNFLTNSAFLDESKQKYHIIEIDFSSSNNSEKISKYQSLNDSSSSTENLNLNETQEISNLNKSSVETSKNSSDSPDHGNSIEEIVSSEAEVETFQRARCKYPEFQFTQEEEVRFWNYKPYPECLTETNDTILMENDQLIAICISKKPPEFFEFTTIPERLGGSKKIIGKWSQTIPNLSNTNFIFVKCQEKSIYSFVFLRFSQSVSDKAKANAQSFKSLHNISQEHRTSVLLLTFDSLSRGSSHRNLKKTIKWLNSNSPAFNSYEFLNPALPEIHTQDNMPQILYGETKKKMQLKLGTKIPAINSKPHLDYQQKSIWTHYSNLGYVTMFLHDTVWDYLSLITGGTILCDHVLANYWKAVWSVYGFHDHQDGARCIGNQHSHNISFGYTLKFFETYPENNKFSFVHLDAAHENKGNIQTVDNDLKLFLEKLIDLFYKRNEKFVVFLIGDHGQRRPEMQFDLRNSYEGRQSLSFILTSKTIGRNDSGLILSHNKEQLFSRFDMHLSLKDISYYPYLINNDTTYEQFKSEYEVKDVKSLFREKISYLRTCDEIGVSYELCPCSDFVNVSSPLDVKLLEEGFLPMIFKVLTQFYAKKIECKVPQHLDVVSFQKFTSSLEDDGLDVLYLIQIKVEELKFNKVRIRGCTEKRISETKNILVGSMFESIVYVQNNVKMFYQVYEFSGAGYCGDTITSN